MTVVPPAAALSGEGEEDTATGRHIKHLVELRRWAKPLQLPEERVTYHVLESEKPAAALIDYATMNDVDQILIGAPRDGAPSRLFPGVCGASRRRRHHAASRSCARGRTIRRARAKDDPMNEFESKGQRFVALCMLGLLLFNYPILALFNVRHRVRSAGAVRLHFHRVGGADRADGARGRGGRLAPCACVERGPPVRPQRSPSQR